MEEKEKGREVESLRGPEADSPFLDHRDFPTRRDLEEVLSLPGKERLNTILNSPDPAELVAQIPPLDLFITLKELGLSDAVELIGLAAPEQIIHFLDLDLWRKDQLHREGIVAWLELLEACGEEKFQQILDKADPEFLTAILQQCLVVRKEENREEDQGKQEEKRGFTLDRIYYVEFREDREAPLLTRILKSLNGYDPVFYQELLDQVYATLPAEEEEAALRWRKGRLADLGFPDFYESLEIYRYLPVAGRAEAGPAPGPPAESSWVAPGYLEIAGQGSFLFRALGQGLAEGPSDRIKAETVHLANQVLVAGGADPGEPEAVRSATLRAFQTLDLGLRHLSREDPVQAARILERIPVFQIFRTGFSLGLDLQFRAQGLFQKGGWFGDAGVREEFLDSPYQEVLRGLFLKQPLYFDPTIPENYRPFLTLTELREVAEKLVAIEILGRILSRLPGYSALEIQALRTRPLYQPDFTVAALLLTGLAQWALTGETALKPLSDEDLEGIGDRLRDPGLGDSWLEALKARAGTGSGEVAVALRGWLALARDRLAEEISRVPAGRKLDPRYVSLVLVDRQTVQDRA